MACALEHAASVACESGMCTVASCADGFADCDEADANGCEVDTSSDEESCGSCGERCGTLEICRDGSCVVL
jgi:hypothetical protein